MRQLVTADGRTHASSVMPVVRSSEATSATVTRSLTPSNDSARPKRPAVERVAPEIVPVFELPDESVTVVPVVSSKPQAPTRPVGSTAGLLTVTLTGLEVVVLPAASRATAVRVCVPLATLLVAQLALQGAEPSSAPSAAPSTRNCTPATPTLSDALAVTSSVPLTVAPPAGAEMLTLGAAVSAVTAACASFDAGPTLPAASSAVTR